MIPDEARQGDVDAARACVEARIEQRVWRMADGSRNLTAITEAIGLADWDILRAAHALLEEGVLELGQAASSRPSRQTILHSRPRLGPLRTAAATLLLCMAAGWLGWTSRALVASRVDPSLQRSWESLHGLRVERGLRHALEIHRFRTGQYPRELIHLSDSGAWDPARAGELERFDYERSGNGYRLSTDAARMRSAAASRSSQTASAGDPSGGSDLSVSRP